MENSLVPYDYTFLCFLRRFNIVQALPVVVEPPLEAKGLLFDEHVPKRLLLLDPLQWKKQDHYIVLGISKLRYKASADEIKRAYRLRVLQFHPDKITQRGEQAQRDDSFFKCIQRAYEILSDPDRRQQFDSVDPEFDPAIPSASAKGEFFELYAPAFKRNARFSKQCPVPSLGSLQSSRDEVNDFYKFWFEFDSWRRFEYLDEEDVETGENREDKRWLEKKNKAARTKLKTEDNARLRKLVEQAFKLDPRIAKFKEEDRTAKADAKAAKEAEQRKIQEELELIKLQAITKERANQEAQKQAEMLAKKEREAIQSAWKNEKRAFKQLFIDRDYFIAEPSKNIKLLGETCAQVEIALQKLSRLELQEVDREVRKLEGSKELDAAAKFNQIMRTLEAKMSGLLATDSPSMNPTKSTKEEATVKEAKEVEWTLKEMDILINACRQFPGGSLNRWESISEWVNRHLKNAGMAERSIESVRKRALEIKITGAGPSATPIVSGGESLLDKEDWEKTILLSKKRDPRIDQAEPTINIDRDSSETEPATRTKPSEPTVLPGTAPSSTNSAAETIWTTEEQKKLETAMKTIPAGVEGIDRWEKIAEKVGSKSKRECMVRAKEIAMLLKQKKTNDV